MAFFQRLRSSFVDDAPGPLAELAGPRSAGAALRRQREALDLNPTDVAAALRIKPAYVLALEAGRPTELPGPAYTIGFLRAYADYLGLDHDEVLRRFKEESPAFARKPDLSFPMPAPGERSIPGAGILLVAMILAICGYGTWYYLSTAEPSRAQRVAEVPAELLAPKPEPHPAGPRSAEALAPPLLAAPGKNAPGLSDAGATFDPAARSAAPAISAPPPAFASPVSTLDPAASALQDLTQRAAVAPLAPAPQGPPSPARGSTRVVIRAAADSWVQIRDGSHSVLVRRVLKAGESYAVPDQPGLAMRTGNAGGLEITVDGNPAPSIGRAGAVRRNVALDPLALMTGTAVRD